MVVSPEILGLAASVVGVLGLILRKARCFVRRVSGRWDGGIGFCDATILPTKSSLQVNECDSHHPNDAPALNSVNIYSEAPRSWELFKRA